MVKRTPDVPLFQIIAAVLAIANVSFAQKSHALENVDTKVYLPVSRSGVMKLLKNSEKWRPDQIIDFSLDLDPAGKKKFEVFQSRISCGSGICHQYIFQLSRGDQYRFIGMIPGRLEIKNSSHHELKDLVSSSRVGGDPTEDSSNTFEFDGKMYRVTR